MYFMDIPLAVAVVIGAAFGAVVEALVTDLVTPIIAAFGGVFAFSAWFFTINGSKFMNGHFINALIGFLVIAAVVYCFVVLPVQKMMDRYKGEPPVVPVATRECPYCLSTIPAPATRCAFCKVVQSLQPWGESLVGALTRRVKDRHPYSPPGSMRFDH
jgi:large conductance mechanosensitive channel